MASTELTADDLKADIATAISQTRRIRRERFWGVVAYWLRHPAIPFTGRRISVTTDKVYGGHRLSFVLTRRLYQGGHELIWLNGYQTCVKCGGVRGDDRSRVTRCGTNKMKVSISDGRGGPMRFAVEDVL